MPLHPSLLAEQIARKSANESTGNMKDLSKKKIVDVQKKRRGLWRLPLDQQDEFAAAVEQKGVSADKPVVVGELLLSYYCMYRSPLAPFSCPKMDTSEFRVAVFIPRFLMSLFWIGI